MRRATRASNDNLDPPVRRRLRKLVHLGGRAMRGDDGELEGDAEARQLLGCQRTSEGLVSGSVLLKGMFEKV